VTDSEGGSGRRNGKGTYLPPPPSADEGPSGELRVPRVAKPSPQLESYVTDPRRLRKRRSIDAWMVVVLVIAVAAAVAYLLR
jgi:hypothetical protein